MKYSFLIAAASSLILPFVAVAKLEVAQVFGDRMVLQREMPVPVWGTAEPGAQVLVSFAGQKVKSTADADGRWRAVLDPLMARSEPDVLRVEAGEEKLGIRDVLVGEVWLGSGQSNMQLEAGPFIRPSPAGARPVENSPGDANLGALIDGAPYPRVRLVSTTFKNNSAPPKSIVWQEATRENLLNFSAQLQSMGVQLSQKLDVPVGLILVAVGGSPSGRWISPEALASDPACGGLIAKAMASFDRAAEEAKFAAAMAKYETEFAAWNQLPEDQKKSAKAPSKPSPVVAPGEGMRWPVGDLRAAVLEPFVGFAIRGVFWDQGESGPFVKAVDQFNLMNALITSWRADWKQKSLPWVYVQKPSGGGCTFDPSDPVFGWAGERIAALPTAVPSNAQNRVLYQNLTKIPDTWMVPTSDLGGGLHPANKYGYGTRALNVILDRVYGKETPSNGPVFRDAIVEGGGIRIHFDHTDGGLVAAQGGQLQGFAIAGADKKFVWADAKIDGDSVIVSSLSVADPKYVRYAWADEPRWANLFNSAGLPALAFTTEK